MKKITESSTFADLKEAVDLVKSGKDEAEVGKWRVTRYGDDIEVKHLGKVGWIPMVTMDTKTTELYDDGVGLNMGRNTIRKIAQILGATAAFDESKKINENTKVTLTFTQLKKLVKEGIEAKNNQSKGRIYGSVDITDPVGCDRLFAYDIEGETGEVILFGADNKDGVFEVLDELLDREGSTPEGQADFDALVDGVWNLEDGQKFDAWHENGTFGGVYMRLK